MSANRLEVPLMSASRQRGLSLFMVFASMFWLLLFTFALITMQLSPPKPSIGRNLVVILLGLGGAGLFGSCSVAIRRSGAYLEGTELYYRDGWFGYRSEDLAKVTSARISEENRYGGFDLRLLGNGNLRKFPLAYPATGVLPEMSRERLAAALAANPDKAVVAEAIATLKSSRLG